MKKLLFITIFLMSLTYTKSFSQNALGSPVILNEIRAKSGSQFVELYNEGGILGQTLSCYTLVIWKAGASPNGDFFVIDFSDGASFNGSNPYLVINSSYL